MYEPFVTLQGARDAVISTSFSPQSRFIAAVGYGGITAWSLETHEMLPVSSDNVYNYRDPDNVYTACAWLHFEQADRFVLIVGSHHGTLSTLNWDNDNKSLEPSLQVPPGEPSNQVLSIDVLQAEVPFGKLARVAVATADNRVTVYSLSSFGDLKEIFTSVVDSFSLIAARFCKKTRDVYAFDLNGGGISLLDNKTGEIKSNHKYGPDPMGTVCVDDSSKYFVACTGKDFEMFRLDNIEHMQTFSGETPVVLFPKVATFAEDGSVLVVGTDCGRASIFSVSGGGKIQDLPYTTTGLVQSVAAITSKDGFLVAIAGSTLHVRPEVLIF
ncbi:WD40-repeat-containing domain protein, partial [Lentinula edodes]